MIVSRWGNPLRSTTGVAWREVATSVGFAGAEGIDPPTGSDSQPRVEATKMKKADRERCLVFMGSNQAIRVALATSQSTLDKPVKYQQV
jgi:hypothetical protein